MSVGPVTGPVQRPNIERDVAELLRRVEILDRVLRAAGLRFNFDNEGGWFYAQTNDCADLDALPDPLAVGGMIGVAFEDDSGCGALFGSNGAKVLIKARGAGAITLESGTSPLTINVNGKLFEFRDDGSIHGPTGGNVVFDT